VFLNPLFAGHTKVAPLGAGMPGVASSQSKPSRPPEPVHFEPHERSFSPFTFTHLPLKQSESLAQKQPLGLVHSLEVPLQAPAPVGQENPVATEFGQPPSGQGTPPSDTPASPPVHTPPTHA
jgi:hypothetical protein